MMDYDLYVLTTCNDWRPVTILIIIISLLLRNSFFFVSHPVTLVIIILAQTSILCVSIFLLSFSSWFSLITFLIFIGGLIVLFIYIARLASNEKFSINFKIIIIMAPLFSAIIFINYIILNNQHFFNETINFKIFIFIIYSNYSINPTILSIIYLLLTLIITVNIIKLYEAPIRSLI